METIFHMKYIYLVLVLSLSGLLNQAIAAIQVLDVANRTVSIDEKIERFVISEGRYLTTLALLNPDNPVEGLVGMISPVSWTNPQLEAQLFERFPEAKDIALFGNRDENSVSVEKIIELEPQVAIFGIQDHGPGAKNRELIEQLSSAGIEVVFIDFRLDPLNNTERSIELLGKVFSAEENAARYLDYYRRKRDDIVSKVSMIKDRPSVFLQAHAGRMDCCRAMADGMLGPFVGLVGGLNIADSVAPGPTSLHTAEFLLSENPDVWIGTASGTIEELEAGKNIVTTGPGMSKELATRSLDNFLAQPEYAALKATQNGRAHALWHNFYNSPLNIVAIEALAKWVHPDQFEDIEPNKTAEEIYSKFLPFNFEGVYTVSATTSKQ